LAISSPWKELVKLAESSRFTKFGISESDKLLDSFWLQGPPPRLRQAQHSLASALLSQLLRRSEHLPATQFGKPTASCPTRCCGKQPEELLDSAGMAKLGMVWHGVAWIAIPQVVTIVSRDQKDVEARHGLHGLRLSKDVV